MKKCTKCDVEQKLEEFHKDKSKKDGFHPVCKNCKKIYNKNNYSKNPEKHTQYSREYRENNPNYTQTYYYSNKEKISQKAKEYRKENEEFWKNRYEKQKKRMEDDLNFKIKGNISTRIRSAIKNKDGIKSDSSIELLGCSILEVRNHLELLFLPGMTWQNYGLHGWHIDHIRPCCSFDLTDPEQQKECFHYSNLQPLWAFDNISKSGKY